MYLGNQAGVPIVCADMPEADRTFLQMAAVFAEWEGRRISERTKAALAAAKQRGVKLGSPCPAKGGAAIKAFAATPPPRSRRRQMPIITALRNAGAQRLRAIASALNSAGIPTSMGGQWHASSVRNLINAWPPSCVASSSTSSACCFWQHC